MGPGGTLDRRSTRLLVGRLNRDARRLAARFGLRYRSIEAERRGVRSRYGVCYSDGVIKIRVRHAVTGRALRYSSLVNTLCHELAHLRHFDHGERFRALYLQILEYARAEGIYRPRRPGEHPAAPPGLRPPRRVRARASTRHPVPVQLDLFGADALPPSRGR